MPTISIKKTGHRVKWRKDGLSGLSFLHLILWYVWISMPGGHGKIIDPALYRVSVTVEGSTFDPQELEKNTSSPNPPPPIQTKILSLVHRAAFSSIIDRFVVSQHTRHIRVDDATIASAVVSTDIHDQSFKEDLYHVSAVVNFNPDRLQTLFHQSGSIFSMVRGPRVVLLPLWMDGMNFRLFDAKNPWYVAWQNQQSMDRLAPIIVPKGDAQDKMIVDDGFVITTDKTKRFAMLDRYSAQSLVIAKASFEHGAEGPTVTVDLQRLQAKGHDISPSYDGIVVRDADEKTVWAKAARVVADKLNDEWIEINPQYAQETPNHTVVFGIAESLKEWALLESRLRKIALIKDIIIHKISYPDIEMHIHFMGGIDRLRRACAAYGLSLSPGAAGEQVRLLDTVP